MPVTVVHGDVRLATPQALMVGTNLQAQIEVNPLETALRDLYPVFFSEYRRAARHGVVLLGNLWFFSAAQPRLIAACVRESATAITRGRYFEQIGQALQQNWQAEGLHTLAIAPLCPEPEWSLLLPILLEYVQGLPFPITLFQTHIEDIAPNTPDQT